MTRTLAAMAATLAIPCAALAGFEQPIDGARYPTAGLLGHREYRVNLRVMPESSLQFGVGVGVKDLAQAAVFYGAQRLIERGSPEFNERVGFEVRVRVIEESSWPAFAIGFSSQGWDEYFADVERYERKSPGFFVAASRNWTSALGDLSLSAGANYSLETGDGDDSPNAFALADWTIARRVSFLFDFDAAQNDDVEDGRFGEGGVWLDAGVRVVLGETVSLMLVFSDLSGNLAPGDGVGRELEIVFLDGF